MATPKILLIEDDEIMRITVSDSMRKMGWSVTVAEDGLEGMNVIKNTIFDIVVSDVRLPKKNGIEILKEIKKYHPDTEVIMITAFGNIEDAVEVVKSGANDYMTKPFHPDNLIFRINKIIDHQK